MIKKTIALCCALLLLFGAGGWTFFHFTRLKPELSSAIPAETTERIENPGRGFYRIYSYRLGSLTDPEALRKQLEENTTRDRSLRLVLIEINLLDFSGGDISDAGLAATEQILSAWAKSSKKMILRFLYDWNGKAKETEPGDISIILRHMEQLAPFVNKYKAGIYTLQGIFVGNHAEMHSSNYMGEEQMRQLLAAYESLTDKDIFLAVRTPAHWRNICQSWEPLADSEAFSGSVAARLGLYNDGMLGSVSDLGTYGADDLTQRTNFRVKGSRAVELDFQDRLCRYVPNGGEVTADTADVSHHSFTDFENAVSDLSRMHISYLNTDHYVKVLDKWKNTTVSADFDPLWAGKSAYEYIQEHLGYRFVLSDLSLVDSNTEGYHPCDLLLSVKNTGFAPIYEETKGCFTLIDEEGTAIIAEIDGDDLRRLSSGESREIACLLTNYREMSKGSYRVYFSLKTKAGEEIRFANSAVPASYGTFLGTLTLD